MYPIVQFSDLTVQIPIERESAILIMPESLIVFYNIQFEFGRNPGSKLKGYIGMSISATVTSCLCYYTYRIH